MLTVCERLREAGPIEPVLELLTDEVKSDALPVALSIVVVVAAVELPPKVWRVGIE